jgi:hypothetical protein
MKMNCLLTPPLPTVQPSFITITYGLIVASCCCHGIPPSDLHGKCRPSSFPQLQSLRISSCFYLHSLLPPSSSFVSHALFDCCVCHHGRPLSIVHRPSSILFRQSSVVSRQHPSSIVRRHVASLSATFPPQHRYHRRLERLIIVYIG